MHIPCRLYANYLSRVLDAEVVNMDLESTDSVEKIVTDTLAQLLQLGVYIHKLGRVCVCVVYAAGSVKRYSVRPSVCPSVCPIRPSAAACGGFAAVQTRRAPSSTACSSKCGQRHIEIRGARINTDLLIWPTQYHVTKPPFSCVACDSKNRSTVWTPRVIIVSCISLLVMNILSVCAFSDVVFGLV